MVNVTIRLMSSHAANAQQESWHLPKDIVRMTTLLAVLSQLVNRPVVAANISSPAFFRVIEEARPALRSGLPTNCAPMVFGQKRSG